MVRVRVTRAGHAGRVNGKLTMLQVGDEYDASPGELKAFSDRLELASSSSARPAPAEPDVDLDIGDDLSDYTRADAMAALDRLGVEYRTNEKRDDLIAKLRSEIESM